MTNKNSFLTNPNAFDKATYNTIFHENTEYKNNFQKLSIKIDKNYLFSKMISITDSASLETYKEEQTYTKILSNFTEFKEEFESSLRFEDIPTEYVSPIEKNFIYLLEKHRDKTLSLVSQWIIDSFDKKQILLNIVKILGNVAVDFVDLQLVVNIALTLNHEDTEIKEYALRIQEKLLDESFHKFLLHAHLAPKWIDEYRLELVEMYNEKSAKV